MKKLSTFLAVIAIGSIAVKAQIINFPDVNLKKAIIKAYPAVDANKDGEISQDEAKTLTNIRGLANLPNIYDATGVEYFTNITELNLSGLINLNKIDVSSNVKLATVNLKNNKLTGTFDASNLVNLTNLELTDNKFENIIFPQNPKIRFLYVNNNQLTKVDLSSFASLQRLTLVNNRLTELIFGNNPELVNVNINTNKLSEVSLKGLAKLNWFSVESNQLTNISFENNPLLKTVIAKNNLLTSLDFMDGITNNLTILNLEGNPDFKLIKKDCKDQIVEVANTIVEDNCSSLSVAETKDIIKIYPTVVSDVINISSVYQSIEYEIIDMSGKRVKNGVVGKGQINLNNLSQGTYFLILKSDKITSKHRFIKL